MSGPEPQAGAFGPTADPAWVISQEGLDPLRDSSRESRFAISNGFLGVRAGYAVSGGAGTIVWPRTYVAGLFDALGGGQPTPGLVPAPGWLQVHVALPGELLACVPDASSHGRTLDMERGVLLTSARLTGPAGVAIRLRMLRLVSLSERALGLQLLRLEVESGEVDITLEALSGSLDFGLHAERLEQDLAVWRTSIPGRRLAIAAEASMRIDGRRAAPVVTGPGATRPGATGPGATRPLSWSWAWRTRPGQVASFERVVALARSDAPDHHPGDEARGRLHAARPLGSRGILDAHAAAWADRWDRSDVAVEGDAAAQQALRFALYHLNGAANPADEHVSIGARALTGEDYRGHVFWDTEIFLLPFYSLTWPEAARSLLMYRFHTLDAARAKAAAMGWRGAMYAWESADTGVETTPEQAIGPDRKVVQILCGRQEQHITADVAYAVWQYWQASGDETFLLDAGAEILLEAGRFWASRAGLEPDGLRHIRGVIGPDEYHEHIDDNAFTNVMARWTIRRAIQAASLLRQRWPARWAALAGRIGLDDAEIAQWSEAAGTIATGLDPRTGLFEQFEGFLALDPIDLASYAGRSVPMDVVLGRERTARTQVVKQADVVALLALLPEEFDAGAGLANYRFYEPRCSHGSSLSRAMHGLAAARLGETEAALRFFRETAAIDLADTHVAIDGGIHIAALGGVWLIAVLGFAGLSLRDDGLGFDPRLPAGWTGLAFRVQWHGRRVAVRIADAGRFEATLQAGEAMTLTLRGTPHALSPGEGLRLPVREPS